MENTVGKENAQGNVKENVIIRVKDLSIDFQVESGTLRACDHTTFDIYRNETIAIIGESGSEVCFTVDRKNYGEKSQL